MKALIPVLALVCIAPAFAQGAAAPADWTEFKALIGEWVADAAGPNDPTGGFVLESALGGRVLVRKNWADYPATKTRPSSRHDDLMVVFKDAKGTRAEYWDNEGHVIRYAVTVPTPGTFVFESEAHEGQPRFRLTQAIDAAGAMAIRFEMAQPNAPNEFQPYITASAHKKR